MVRAFIGAKLGCSEYLGACKTSQEEIAKIPGVLRVNLVFGRYDVIVEVEVKNMDEMSRLVTDRIRSVSNVVSTETFICHQPTF
jgi:Lrp/AsnC family transcriptional regulator for asnA, asnC and gidA